VRELDAIVGNKYRNDRPTLAAWESASRVERVPRRKKVPGTPAPTVMLGRQDSTPRGEDSEKGKRRSLTVFACPSLEHLDSLTGRA
jgi:hypothetical protein